MGRSLPRSLILAVGVAVALALASCGGDSKDKGGTATPAAPPTPAGTTVASDDGALSILIPDGAMPEGTQVSITAVPNDQLPVELSQLLGSGTGYLLEPDGLTLSQPATATLTLQRSELDDEEGAQSAYGLVSFSATAGREVLDSNTSHTLGEETVTVQAEIEHFSYISRTKGALYVGLNGLQRRRGVGEQYELTAGVDNFRGSIVAITNIGARWLDGAPVALTTPREVPLEDIGGEAGSHASTRATFSCERPGTGSNGINVRGVSHVIDLPDLTTTLALTLEDVVECVEGTVVQPTSPPSTEAPPGPVLHLEQNIGCEHTNPGVSSELQKRGRLTDDAGIPVRGVVVSELASGPGLVYDEENPGPEVRAGDVTNENGEFELVWTIVSGGPYTTTVERLSLITVLAKLDGSSTSSSQYTVTEVCVPPAQVR
ncbi:MAG: hypothetical protein WEB04_07805 [Dehalococcoidia bacterium]